MVCMLQKGVSHAKRVECGPLLSGRNSVVILANKVVVSEGAVKFMMILMEVDLRYNGGAILADQGAILLKGVKAV